MHSVQCFCHSSFTRYLNFICIYVCAHAGAFVSHSTYVCRRSEGNLQGLSHLPPRSQELNSGCQGWRQTTPLHTKPSRQPSFSNFFFFEHLLCARYWAGLGHAARTHSLPVWADWEHGMQWLGLWTLGPENLDLFLLQQLSAV